jgi:hypothetical protein
MHFHADSGVNFPLHKQVHLAFSTDTELCLLDNYKPNRSLSLVLHELHFLFSTVSRTALGPTQPPIQWVPRDVSLGVKPPGREADNSPPSSTEVKE